MKKILLSGLLLFILIFISGCTSQTTTPTTGSLINRSNYVQPSANTGNDNPPSGISQDDESCLIKGNISSSGEKIYHVPGGSYYDRTVIDESKGERWFCSEQEAQAAGWRKSKR